MKKNLDINSCTLCKHIDYTRGSKGDHTLCLLESKIIKSGAIEKINGVVWFNTPIPEWCPLPNYDEPELLKKE